jgi:hypothetical protein
MIWKISRDFFEKKNSAKIFKRKRMAVHFFYLKYTAEQAPQAQQRFRKGSEKLRKSQERKELSLCSTCVGLLRCSTMHCYDGAALLITDQRIMIDIMAILIESSNHDNNQQENLYYDNHRKP